MPQITSSKRSRDPGSRAPKAKANKTAHKIAGVGEFSTKRDSLFRPKKAWPRLRWARAAMKNTLGQLRVDDQLAYPLRHPISVRVSLALKGYRAVCPQLAEVFAATATRGDDFEAVGRTPKKAIAKLIAKFDRLVKEHRWQPLHERSEQDRRINAILDRLVDWDKFHALRPVKQPLWGKLLKLNDDGSARVFWLIGPRGIDGLEASIGPSDVPPQLHEIGHGEWFYSTAYVLPKRIKWVEPPVGVPDPHDEAALKAAWDLIPVEVMNDPNAWPLKKPE